MKSYIKHVGRHLEQLALHALPKIEDEQPEDEVHSGEQNDEASKLSAISANDNSCDISSKSDELPETGGTSGRHAVTVGHDGEGDVIPEEVPDGHVPMQDVASPISSDLETRIANHLLKNQSLEELSEQTWQEFAKKTAAEVAKKLVELGKNSQEDAIGKLEEYVKKSEQALIGSKEQEQLPTDPSDEAGSISQDARTT